MRLYIVLILFIGAEAYGPFVEKPWSADVIKIKYASAYPVLMDIPFHLGILLKKIFYRSRIGTNDFGLELMIAQDCAINQPQVQINCVAHAVKSSVKRVWFGKDRYWRVSAQTWEWSTPCQDMARRFYDTFNCLALPGSAVGYTFTVRHVLNLIQLTDNTGQIYIYALDVGWSSEHWYPYNTVAKTFHQKTRGWPTFLSPYQHNETASCWDRQRNIGKYPSMDDITSEETVVTYSYNIVCALLLIWVIHPSSSKNSPPILRRKQWRPRKPKRKNSKRWKYRQYQRRHKQKRQQKHRRRKRRLSN